MSDSVLLIAAGGGGDALGSAMVADALGLPAAGIATFAWERKMFDPRPGPRAPRDFRRLHLVGPGTWNVTPRTQLKGGHSFLPRLASVTTAPILLMDPSEGAHGLGRQLREMMATVSAERALIIDVGGDILAEGLERGLRSPLADALVLAAASELPEVRVATLGMGLDGELTETECHQAWRDGQRNGGWLSHPLPYQVAKRFRSYFRWHPSEVTGLACLAALGYRGKVELRRCGVIAPLSSQSALIHTMPFSYALERNNLGEALVGSHSLGEVEAVLRRRLGPTELDFERRVVERLPLDKRSSLRMEELRALEAQLLEYCDEARGRGVDFLTLRRVGEILGLQGYAFDWFRRYLRRRHPHRAHVPVFACSSGRITSARVRQHLYHLSLNDDYQSRRLE